MNDLPKLHITKFDLEEYGHGDGMIPPPHPILRGRHNFNLKVENCRITDVRVLYSIIAEQLKIESDIIKQNEKENFETHHLQYGVVEFLKNILDEMKKVDGLDNLDYYVIKTR